MIPPDLQSKLSALTLNLGPEIGAVQSLHLSLHGRFWQGAMTHATVPADGVPAAPNLDVKPSDEGASWRSMGIELPAQCEAAFSVEAYVGPHGPGYVLHTHVISQAVRYHRAIASGPESWRGHDWLPVKTGI